MNVVSLPTMLVYVSLFFFFFFLKFFFFFFFFPLLQPRCTPNIINQFTNTSYNSYVVDYFRIKLPNWVLHIMKLPQKLYFFFIFSFLFFFGFLVLFCFQISITFLFQNLIYISVFYSYIRNNFVRFEIYLFENCFK